MFTAIFGSRLLVHLALRSSPCREGLDLMTSLRFHAAGDGDHQAGPRAARAGRGGRDTLNIDRRGVPLGRALSVIRRLPLRDIGFASQRVTLGLCSDGRVRTAGRRRTNRKRLRRLSRRRPRRAYAFEALVAPTFDHEQARFRECTSFANRMRRPGRAFSTASRISVVLAGVDSSPQRRDVRSFIGPDALTGCGDQGGRDGGAHRVTHPDGATTSCGIVRPCILDRSRTAFEAVDGGEDGVAGCGRVVPGRRSPLR